jgi:MFS family permease
LKNMNMPARVPESDAQPARIGALWLGIQAVWGAVLAISLQSRAIELTHGDPLKRAGAILALGAAIAAIVQIVAGTLSDRRRKRGSQRIEFYVVGTLVGTIGIGWFYLAPTIAQLTIGYAILQVGLNAATGAYQAIVPDTFQGSRVGLASSWLAALQSAGNALGAIVAALVSQARVVAAVLGAVLIAGCATTVAHLRGRTLQPIENEAVRIPVARFSNLFGSRLLLYAGFYSLVDYLYFAVANLSAQAPPAQIKLLSAVSLLLFTACGALGAFAVARASDRADKRTVISVGGGMFAISLLALVFARNFFELAGLAGVAGAGWGIVLVADWALACRLLPIRTMATSMAVWNLAVLLGQVMAPLVVNSLLARLGMSGGPQALSAIFSIAAIEACFGILWIWRLPGALARE